MRTQLTHSNHLSPKSLAIAILALLLSTNLHAAVATFSGDNLNLGSSGKTVGSITLTSSDMSYSSGLYASSSNKTFTLTASGANISQVLITMSSTSNRYTATNITNCTSATRSGSVYTCVIDPATDVVSCKNNGGGVTITQIDVTYAASSTCSATQPGTISKGNLTAGTITLTASGSPASDNVWYWQTTADGVVETESGATKNVSAASTYYIRSKHTTENCWSAAQSVTVTAEDFYTPCEIPTITTQPSTAAPTYNKGDAASSLSVSASVGDGGTLSYQWYSNTTASNTGGTLISGATSSTYTPSTATAGSLYYYCIIKNSLSGYSDVTAASDVSGEITVESSCPGTGGGVLFGWTPKNGLSETDISAGTHSLPGEWLASLSGGSAEMYVKSSGGMRIKSSELNYNSGDCYIHAVLDCEIMEGDVISVTSSANTNPIKITTTSTKPGSSGSILAATITQGTDFVIPSGNQLIGLTEFYIWRNSSSTNIGTFTITRPKTGATYTWTCPDAVTQGSSTVISVASDCVEPVTLSLANGPIDGVSFDPSTGTLTVANTVPIGTAIKIKACNSAGSGTCAATTETKTILVSLPAPTFVWNYTPNVYAGARYPISVTSPDGVTITLTLVDDPVPAGIATNISGNAGTYEVNGTFLGSTLTFKASSPETSAFRAYSETRTVNITTCFTNNIIYVTDAGYVNAGSSSKPRYYYDQTNVGRLGKGFGGSSMSTTSTYSATLDGYDFNRSVSVSDMYINPYMDNVVKVRLYVHGGGNNRSVTGVYYSDSYFNNKANATDITSSSSIVYESGTSFGSVDTYVDIYPSVLLGSLEYLYITFSSGVYVFGVNLVTSAGSESATIAWTTAIPNNTKRVTEGDNPFTYTAAPTGSIQSLGTLSYSSSDTQVATVDPLTGRVTILDNGSSIITATLSASGCYAESTVSYRVEVAECKDDPCIISAPKTAKCPSESVTLTVDDCEEFATIAWYKDGVLIPGETATTLSVSDPGDYKAVATKNCHQHSNVITISDLTAAPTVEAVYSYYYIKHNLDDFHSYNIPLFTVTNADVITPSFDLSLINCSLVLEDGTVYLQGQPTISTNEDRTLTLTVENSCTGATNSASMVLHLLAPTARPTVAWVCEGSSGGGFTEGISSSQGSSNPLFVYLNTTGGYSLTAVNNYATTDETLIAQYYSQFDIIVMTDFPNSKTKDGNGKSYTNAVGSLIDKKPMLSMEAFVSAQPNWRISSDPNNPSTRQKKMKLLCAAHQIFDPAVEIGVYDDGGQEYVNVLTNTDGSKTLQGFSPVSIPDFIFIATIDGGSHGELVTCCERQTVIQSRFMILGIESSGMSAMETGAKQMVKQILDYLLIADPTLIADCSLVFDNGKDGAAPGSGDNLWSNPANWGPNHGTIIPSPFHAVRIERPCKVDVTDAHASSARLAQGTYLTKTYNGSIEVLSTGALSLTGFIKRTYNNDFLTRYPLEFGDITVHADATGNGALIWGDPTGDVPANVDYYSKGSNATTTPVWQYMGSPVSDRPTALGQFRDAWMCRWSYVSNPELGGTWSWVLNEDRIDPFVGYCITQISPKTYYWAGLLNKPETKVLPLTYSSDAQGFAMVANSWVAPINIGALENGDFDGADPTIYIFNTGTYAQYAGAGSEGQGDKTGDGQYNAIPVNAASYVGLKTIPPMQGFFIQTNRNGNLTLDYKKVVLDTINFVSTTSPMRSPARRAEGDAEEIEEAPSSGKIVPDVLRINITSEHWGDKVFLLSHSEFSEAYELGWEGRKQEGDARAPYLAVNVPAGPMSVAAVNGFLGNRLRFRAGIDSVYTFSFEYADSDLALIDQLTGAETPLQTGYTYTFTSKDHNFVDRFIISTRSLSPTDLELIEQDDELIIRNDAEGVVEITVFDMQGRTVRHHISSDAIINLPSVLPAGVYMARIKAGDTVKVVKLIGKEGAL